MHNKGAARRGFRLALLSGKNDNGFTLIEVLVATAIAAGMLVALYASFFSVIRGRDSVDAALERTREMSRFLDVFSSEVHSSFYSDKNAVTFFSGDSSIGASRLSFTAFSYPLVAGDRPASDVIAVRYSLQDAGGGVKTLFRETWNPYSATNDAPMKAEVIEDVEGFDVSYYNGSDWSKAWNAKFDKKLPVAVKVVLAIKEKGIVREYPISARTMIR